MKVPLVDLHAQHATIREEVMAAATGVIEAQAFILGEPVARFERTLAGIAGAKHAVGVGSGTDALVLALRALDVKSGDAVLVPSLTFVATAEAVVSVGARPIFVDVDARTLTLDPAAVEARLERSKRSGERVRAILPVHLFGHCAEMAALRTLAKAHGAVLVEDAAQAMGARDRDGVAGSLGDAGCFSFFPSKNLGAWGDGGAVTTSDPRVAERIRRLRQHGMGSKDSSIGGSRAEGDPLEEPGMNSRLDALHAAVLDVKARHLEAWTVARRGVASRYGELLAGIADLDLPTERPGARHVYHQYVVRTPRRDLLAAHLAERGITSRAYYARPVHRQQAYSAFEAQDLHNTEAASRELLALPMYAELPENSQVYVADAIRAFL